LKFDPVHSDLRVCAAKEPKPELKDLVRDVQKANEVRQRSLIVESKGSKTQETSVSA
jgi:hypothetical protein